MNNSLPSSRSWSFAAGFLTATVLSGVALTVSSIRAELGLMPPADPININQLLNFHGEWMNVYDLNHNGIPDFGERGKARDGSSYNLMFVSHMGDTVPDFCRLGGNWQICGTEPSIAAEQFYDMTPELCDDGLDNESDGLADCQDPQCAQHPQCHAAAPLQEVKADSKLPDDKRPTVPTMSTCSVYDCWKPDCSGTQICMDLQSPPSMPRTITTPQPVNADFETEITEPAPMPPLPGYQLVPFTNVVPSSYNFQSSSLPPIGPNTQTMNPFNPLTPNPTFICDSVSGDDDRDGIRNYADNTCFSGMPMQIVNPTIGTEQNSSLHGAGDNESVCDNGRDDDGDSRLDGSDPDCICSGGTTESSCPGAVECENSRDDDGDQRIDRADPDCSDFRGER